jgi:hypothetical protein
LILLPPPSKYCDYRQAPPHPLGASSSASWHIYFYHENVHTHTLESDSKLFSLRTISHKSFPRLPDNENQGSKTVPLSYRVVVKHPKSHIRGLAPINKWVDATQMSEG